MLFTSRELISLPRPGQLCRMMALLGVIFLCCSVQLVAAAKRFELITEKAASCLELMSEGNPWAERIQAIKGPPISDGRALNPIEQQSRLMHLQNVFFPLIRSGIVSAAVRDSMIYDLGVDRELLEHLTSSGFQMGPRIRSDAEVRFAYHTGFLNDPEAFGDWQKSVAIRIRRYLSLDADTLYGRPGADHVAAAFGYPAENFRLFATQWNSILDRSQEQFQLFLNLYLSQPKEILWAEWSGLPALPSRSRSKIKRIGSVLLGPSLPEVTSRRDRALSGSVREDLLWLAGQTLPGAAGMKNAFGHVISTLSPYEGQAWLEQLIVGFENEVQWNLFSDKGFENTGKLELDVIRETVNAIHHLSPFGREKLLSRSMRSSSWMVLQRARDALT